MSEERIYKKGTTIKFSCSANLVGSTSYHIEVLSEDTSSSVLDDMAQEYMQDALSPEFWFEVL